MTYLFHPEAEDELIQAIKLVRAILALDTILRSVFRHNRLERDSGGSFYGILKNRRVCSLLRL